MSMTIAPDRVPCFEKDKVCAVLEQVEEVYDEPVETPVEVPEVKVESCNGCGNGEGKSEYTIGDLFSKIAERDEQFALIEIRDGIALETANGLVAQRLHMELSKHLPVSLDLCFGDIILSKYAQKVFFEMKNCMSAQFHIFKNHVKVLMNSKLIEGSRQNSMEDYNDLKAVYAELKGLPLPSVTASTFLITSYQHNTCISRDVFLQCVSLTGSHVVARESIIPEEVKGSTFMGIMDYLAECDNILVEKLDQGCRLYFATGEQEEKIKSILRESSHTYIAKRTPLGVVIGFYI